MKFLPVILIVVIGYFIINNVSGTNWNIGIYGLFVVLLGYKLFVNLKVLYKIRSARVCDGIIISYTKQKPDETENINYNVKVKFILPLNNKEYIVKSGIEFLPKNNVVDVMIDETNPENSKAYAKFNIAKNLWLVLPLLFFIYKLIESV